jgi:tetratricopeptide (TPR) repeat protein
VVSVLRLLSAPPLVYVVAPVFLVAVIAAFYWAHDLIERPWNRLLRAVDFNDSIAAYNAGAPAAVEDAWRLHDRVRDYANRPQRRFRVAAAAVDGVVGSCLTLAERWEDALAHLLPAITRLRGVNGMERNLVLHLEDAAVAMQALDDPESALALIDEALAILRPDGLRRWRTPLYYRALRLRIYCLLDFGQLDEALRMSAEVVSAARKGHGDEGLIGTLLVQYAGLLTIANRLGEAAEPATVGVRLVTRLKNRNQLCSAVRVLAYLLLLTGDNDQASTYFRMAFENSTDRPENVLDRIRYAQALNRLGRTDEAHDLLGEEPEDAKGFYAQQDRAVFALVQAEILERRGRSGEAMAAAQRAEDRFTALDKTRRTRLFEPEFADLRRLRQDQV